MKNNIKKSEEILNGKRIRIPIIDVGTDFNYKHKIVWLNVAVFIILHLIGFYSLVHIVTGKISLLLGLFSKFYYNNTSHTMISFRMFICNKKYKEIYKEKK